MAIIKAINSKSPIGGALDYITDEKKTESHLISAVNCSVERAKEEMEMTKMLYKKTEGRSYKHFTQSFHEDENITPEQAHELAKAWVEQCPQFKVFEVVIATHIDQDHIHNHIVMNSVSMEDGHKFQMHKQELQDMKDLSDKLCREQGLSITEKGKTFHGEERTETSTYSKETYQLLKQAEQGEVKSYVQDIALAILDNSEIATSKDEFIELMEKQGIEVKWEDNLKYITFTDLERQQNGEKACKIRNNKLEKYYNLPFGKEDLLHEFERSLQRKVERTNRGVTRPTQDSARRERTPDQRKERVESVIAKVERNKQQIREQNKGKSKTKNRTHTIER